MVSWHSIFIEEIFQKLEASKFGLAQKEVKRRLLKYGKNKLPEEKPPSNFKMFLDQFKSPLIYILIIAGIITLFFKEYSDSIVIFLVVILNTTIGFYQERRATKTFLSLKKVVKTRALVIREGKEMEIDAEDLVPGDIVVLVPGFKVPADGRIIESFELKVNEAPLTGEWLPAEKEVKVIPKDTPLADRDNMVYMGCDIFSGKGKMIICKSGEDTEIGKIIKIVKETKKEKTPYQRKIANFSKILGFLILGLCILIFIEGLWKGGFFSGAMDSTHFLRIFEIAVAIAVSAIPEGLPIAMTIILAVGMQRILESRGLVKRLVAAETLGSTSVVCTDKTGTLTRGKMKVKEVFPQENESQILKCAIAANSAFIENPDDKKENWILRGDPTDQALLLWAQNNGYKKPEFDEDFPVLDEEPFDRVKKTISSLRKGGGQNILYIAGAPEELINKCSLQNEEKKDFLDKLEEMTSRGFRVIGFAKKEVKENLIEEVRLDNLEFLGLIGLFDPPREDVKEAIEICKGAGIRPIIVTGDHKLTAATIAGEIGFDVSRESVIEGRELDEMSDEELARRLGKINVYARVEPKHKMRIIEMWQKKGEVIAMTGDGINDVPAIQKADIGLAVGSGTDVAKETADLILLEDNFSILRLAIERGRAIIDNIRKVIVYLLSDSFTEIILVGFSIFTGMPLPVTAIQILWINLIEDGLPNIALAFEKPEKDLMEKKPEPKSLPLLNQEMKTLIFIIGIVTDILLLGLFIWLFKIYGIAKIDYIRTMIFAGLAIDSLFFVFSCRSLRHNLWQINVFSNKLLNMAVIVSFIILFGSIYLPFMQNLFDTVPLVLGDWILLFLLGVLNVTLIELTKWYFISRHKT